MATSYLFGLEHANHRFDGSDEASFGKNIFTNAFPLALLSYLDSLGLGPMYVEAVCDQATGGLSSKCSETTFDEVIGCSSKEAEWLFEHSFDGYSRFATKEANCSDVVVRSVSTGEQVRALEVKLVTVPNSATALKPRDNQSCEIVIRPPSIEQLCFSMAASFGEKKRHELGDIITEELGRPMDYRWESEEYMVGKIAQVVQAAEAVALEGIERQTPFALTAIWRTRGQAPILDSECFDAFIWSDMAFVQLVTRAAKRGLGSKKISRSQRSVVWLVKSLLDYATQRTVTFGNTHSKITYGAQTDKAGSFSGEQVLEFIGCEEFVHPRVSDRQYSEIVSNEGIVLLKPERRLDAALVSARALGKYISLSS